jgi:hypothetical protein
MKFSAKEIQLRKVLAIAALGVAGCLSVAACATAGPAALPSRPQAAATDNSGVARDIARIALGNGGLTALNQGDGLAALATCDLGTVSRRSGVTPSRPLCAGLVTLTDRSGGRQSP